jgi:dihydroorotate dehydrogenase electron transfer subunit
MTKYFRAIVLENTVLNKHFRLLTIDAGRSTLNAQRIPVPGQFYMLQVGDTYDPLLKRPFSIFRHEDNSLSFLYRIRGKGTRSLSHLKSGDIINVIGPLGNSYPEPHGDFIALAGGIGIASLLHLLTRFKNRAYLFYGARNKEELVMTDEAKILAKEVFIATDDGSEGQKGLVTDLLKNFFDASRITHHASRIYACGPSPMLRELSKVVAENPSSLLPLNKGRMGGVKCYVSLEEHMACGVGACLGCVVKVRSQKSVASSQKWIYKRVCKEGPVFDIKDIVWE